MARVDVEELDRYIGEGRIARLDSYVGEIFRASYAQEWVSLCELHDKHGGRAAIFRNNSKVFVGFGTKYDFVIESSANVNTNPRTENTVITVSTTLAERYKEFYDGIRSFERNYDNWTPYNLTEAKNGKQGKPPPAAD
jgi:hypothetical protein